MASPANILVAPIPRPLLYIGTPIAGIVLVVIFVFLGFPYGQLAELVSARLSEATGEPVHVRDLEPRITIAGPGMTLRDVRITRTARGMTYLFDPVRLRPAWSTSWLALDPALHIDLGSPYGGAVGTLVVAENASFEGAFSQVDLAQLPIALPAGLELVGLVEADTALAMTPDGPLGEVTFQATAGSIAHSSLPIPLEFEQLTGNLTIGQAHWIEIRQLDLEGPLLSATAQGHIERGRSPGREPISLSIEIEIKSPPIQAMLRGLGVSLDGNGRALFQVGGTLSAPKLR